MSADDQISELLLRWEELRRRGEPADPEELCRHCPGLLPELRRRIAALLAVYQVLNTAEPDRLAPGEQTGAPVGPSPASWDRMIREASQVPVPLSWTLKVMCPLLLGAALVVTGFRTLLSPGPAVPGLDLGWQVYVIAPALIVGGVAFYGLAIWVMCAPEGKRNQGANAAATTVLQRPHAGDLPNIPGYDVEAELGRGGMGVVYRVRHQATASVLALKMILCGRGATFQELARFRIEAEAMACLDHPNIIKIRDVGVFSGYPFFALDYAARGSLKQVAGGRPQAVRWSAELVRTLALAMQHAHGRGMLHRDLKPANILIMADGTPAISDFGLVKFAAPMARVRDACSTFSVSELALDEELLRFARELSAQYQPLDAADIDEEELTLRTWQECATRTGALGDGGKVQAVRAFLHESRRQALAPPCPDGLTRSGAVMGSPSYMAPEQALGDLGRIGPHTDVYGLGGILYELLTGRPPFVAPERALGDLLGRIGDLGRILTQVVSQPPCPLRRLEPSIPPALEAICLRCLEKDVERRPPRASDLADDLTHFLEDHSPDATGDVVPVEVR
jgi:serine/threonine protein kinase